MQVVQRPKRTTLTKWPRNARNKVCDGAHVLDRSKQITDWKLSSFSNISLCWMKTQSRWKKRYRAYLLVSIQLSTFVGLTFEFQVSSVNKYDPPMELAAARDHMTHLVYQMMQPQVLYDRLGRI